MYFREHLKVQYNGLTKITEVHLARRDKLPRTQKPSSRNPTHPCRASPVDPGCSVWWFETNNSFEPAWSSHLGFGQEAWFSRWGRQQSWQPPPQRRITWRTRRTPVSCPPWWTSSLWNEIPMNLGITSISIAIHRAQILGLILGTEDKSPVWAGKQIIQYEQENKLYIFIVWWQFYNILAFKAIWRATQKSRADLSQPVLISLKCYLRYVVPLLEPIVEHCSFIFSNVHWIANVHRTPLPSDHFNFPQMPGYLGDLLVTLHTIHRV